MNENVGLVDCWDVISHSTARSSSRQQFLLVSESTVMSFIFDQSLEPSRGESRSQHTQPPHYLYSTSSATLWFSQCQIFGKILVYYWFSTTFDLFEGSISYNLLPVTFSGVASSSMLIRDAPWILTCAEFAYINATARVLVWLVAPEVLLMGLNPEAFRQPESSTSVKLGRRIGFANSTQLPKRASAALLTNAAICLLSLLLRLQWRPHFEIHLNRGARSDRFVFAVFLLS